jgi:hypothetical protein
VKLKIIIRFETGNKYSLIGIYDEKIIFNSMPNNNNQWPKRNKLGIFARFILEGESLNSFSFKVIYNGKEKEIGKGLLSDEMLKSNRITLPLIHNNFEFSEKGLIEFQFDFYDGDENNIQSIKAKSTLKVEERLIDPVQNT